MQYSIDTSALLDAWVRWYPIDVFPSFWDRMDELVEDRTIVATEEVLNELERKDDDLHKWIKARPELLVPHDAAVQTAVSEILAQFPKMVDERTGKSMADPFVIAVARVHQLAVVTGEKGGTPTRPKIPNVCAHFGIRTLSVLEMIREAGWSF